MKKLLSLLSVLTISGTAVPTTIAASPYQKEQTIRGKRQTQNPIFKTNGADKPTEKQIKEKLNQKYPHISVDQIKVKNITANSVNITIDGFSSEKILYFTVDKSVPINKIITITNLEEIDINKFGGTYDEQLLKHFLKQLNPQLDINKINVIEITTNTAKVNSNDTNIYTGEIVINYTRPLSLLISKLKLGSIRINGYLPTKQEIKDKLKEKNPTLASIINELEIKDITLRNAKITFKRNNFYSGNVEVNFISTVNLNKIITNPSLGEFMTNNLSNPSEQQIKDKLKEMYSDLDITKIKVENITNSSATINSADETIYTKNVNVDYTVSIDSLN